MGADRLEAVARELSPLVEGPEEGPEEDPEEGSEEGLSEGPGGGVLRMAPLDPHLPPGGQSPVRPLVARSSLQAHPPARQQTPSAIARARAARRRRPF